MVVVAVATGPHTNNAQCSNWANPNLSGLTELVDYYSNAGNGGGFGVAAGTMPTAGDYGSTTATVATSFVQGRISLALKPKWISNYQLDLEVQWANADHSRQNEYLCIYAGAVGNEYLQVDVWTGSSWSTVIPALSANTWNNVSVSAYLTSGTFTIRFKATAETGDPTQDSWQIDCVLLHTWDDEYTAEVEFSGASNNGSWTQLVWTVDSCLTEASVNVTVQLYNYVLGGYPTSGDGYTGYTSSSTPNTDETVTQTITANPERFRDASGNWKIKIKCVKTAASQFEFKADMVKFEPTYYSEYTASTEFLFTGMTMDAPAQLNVTIVSQYNVTGVTVTVQVWNYVSGSYATGGEGYLQHISSGVNETKTLTITVNPEAYTRNGEAKIKITAVKTTLSPFQQETNQIEMCFHALKYHYVLQVANQASEAWKIRLTAYSQSNINRLSNCTIYFTDPSGTTTSNQILIRSGAYIQQQGSWQDLAGLDTVYIAMTVSTSNMETSHIHAYLEILIPNTSTYNLMTITFEIS